MKLIKLFVLISLLIGSIYTKNSRSHHRHSRKRAHLRKPNHAKDVLEVKIYIYEDKGFNLEQGTHVTFDLNDLKDPQGEKKNAFYVKLEPDSKFYIDGVFKPVSGSTYALDYQYLTSVKYFFDTDKYRYFYFYTSKPKTYNVAIQFSQRENYDDTITVIGDEEFNSIMAMFSNALNNRKSQITKLKDTFLTTANTYYTSKEKAETAQKGAAEIEKKLAEIRKSVQTTIGEKLNIEGKDEIIRQVIERLEKEVATLKEVEKKNNALLMQKTNFITQQEAAAKSLTSGQTSVDQYLKEMNEAREKYVQAGKDYSAEVDDKTKGQISTASNILLTENSLAKFKAVIEKLE